MSLFADPYAQLRAIIDAQRVNPVSAPRPGQRFGWGQAPCGTSAAYERHRRAGEPACAACRAAHRERVRGCRARRVARSGG